MDATGLCRCMVELAGRAALLPSSKLGSARASKGEGGDYRGEATASRLASTVVEARDARQRGRGGHVEVKLVWRHPGHVEVKSLWRRGRRQRRRRVAMKTTWNLSQAREVINFFPVGLVESTGNRGQDCF